MKRRDLLKGLPLLLLSLLILEQGAESFIPEEYQSKIAMKYFDANSTPVATISVYLDGTDVSNLTTSTVAPLLPNIEAEGWCELLVLNDDGIPFSLEVGGKPVTEIREGMVQWEPYFQEKVL